MTSLSDKSLSFFYANAKYNCFHVVQKGSNLFLFDFYSLILSYFIFDVRNESVEGNTLSPHKITHKTKSPTVVRTEGVQIPIGDLKFS